MKLRNKLFYSAIISFFAFSQKASAALTFQFNSPIAQTDVKKLLTNSLKWILTVAGSIALVALVVAGISYMTSMGSVEKAKKAKKTVFWIIGGLVLIMLSYSILAVLDSIFA